MRAIIISLVFSTLLAMYVFIGVFFYQHKMSVRNSYQQQHEGSLIPFEQKAYRKVNGFEKKESQEIVKKTTVSNSATEYWGVESNSMSKDIVLDHPEKNADRITTPETTTLIRRTEQLENQTIQLNYSPVTFNIDFGIWRPQESFKSGPAADGQEGDYWNTVGVAWKDYHIERQLRNAKGQASPIVVEMINLGGGWSNKGVMKMKDFMYDNYNYPQNNQGGNSQVNLLQVPAGTYHIYIYGHAERPEQNSRYMLTVGEHNYGVKATSQYQDAIDNIDWVEGSQYVKFSNITVFKGEEIQIYIRPEGQSSRDTIINGLQLIPVSESHPIGRALKKDVNL